MRFARQHDRLQFAGGVDECECVAHIGFFHDPVLCAPAAGLVILTGNSRTWLAIAVFTGHVKNPWKRRNEAVYGGIPTFCADIALKDAPTSTSDRCFFIISSSLFPSSSFSPSFSFLPPPMYQRIILIKKGARIAHRYAQSHISHIGGITPFPSISCSFARRTDSHLS